MVVVDGTVVVVVVGVAIVVVGVVVVVVGVVVGVVVDGGIVVDGIAVIVALYGGIVFGEGRHTSPVTAKIPFLVYTLPEPSQWSISAYHF